jgi:hypothetical protein
MAFPQQPALRCPKNEAHGVMEELTPIIEKDSEGVERFKKTVWDVESQIVKVQVRS